ncbi:chalcone isomerase family protein [Parahaliea mediterranea]|uniref:Chalcone isomerase family protein n=1 Tax=Parahaliea mediterranea TaxID=651086 RepID=A0A939ILW3_9GAMM|nr:chalcone isomerase family protein [Parahaliea mediterranea]MBN7796382.1 chalcone isomerase family protein [Parahaliea mediterranea]
MKKLLLLLLLAAGVARGATNDNLALVGEAQLDVFVWSVYRSRLFAPEGEYAPQSRPLRLEITYLHDISAEQLVRRTEKEWRHLGLKHPQQDHWLESLRSLWPDVSQDDTLVLELNKGEQSHFYFNGHPIGRIDHPDFGAQFLAIWLSPQTSQPALRRKLLGE